MKKSYKVLRTIAITAVISAGIYVYTNFLASSFDNKSAEAIVLPCNLGGESCTFDAQTADGTTITIVASNMKNAPEQQ